MTLSCRPRLPSHLFTAVALTTLTALGGCASLVPPKPGAPAPAPAPASAGWSMPTAAPSAAVAPPRAASGVAPSTPTASGAPSAATPPAVPPAPGQPPAFATVVKDAKQDEGLIAVWRKEDKVWLELKPEDFDKPFFLSPKIAQGIGEPGFYGGTMIGNRGRTGRAQVIEFRRVHNLVQMVAVNTQYGGGDAKSPSGRAVAAAFSHSLLGTAPVASAPHPERNTVLVEASPFFLGDMLGLGMALQRTYRQGYSLEPRNTHFTTVRALPDQVVFNVNAHFYTGNIGVPTPGMPPGAPVPSVPDTLPDARSLVLGLYYAIAKLPDTTMSPRLADPRVGYFSTSVYDYSDDLRRTPRRSVVNRWRLEKKDPAAELSQPVKPVTFWVDRTVPLKYRDAIVGGILEWNKAFEKIGLKDAIVAKIQPDDADFDTLDVGAPSVRWMTNAETSFGAIGPSQIDPRSGEIIDADIAIESLSLRSVRELRARVVPGAPAAAVAAFDWARAIQLPDAMAALGAAAGSPDAHAGHGHAAGQACEFAGLAGEQLGYGLDALAARGDLDPDSPEAQAFVLGYLKALTIHEVGHTLGLRHNFRSSRIYTDRQLSDRAFTEANGLVGSTMEYTPINLARPGENGGVPFQTVLGPYDYWAIEYAYKPMPPGATAADEKAELLRIAGRSAEPALAFGTDEDTWLGIDPESLQLDLGDDPMAFAKKRLDIARDLLARQEQRTLKPDEDYAVLRRSVNYALRDAGRAAGFLARQIGGVRTLRDFPGSGRDPLVPVPAKTQREALDVLARGVLASDAFRISPALARKLAPDFADRTAAIFGEGDPASTDFSLSGAVLGLQRALLAQLMSDGVAGRLLDSEGKVEPGQSFPVAELYGRISREVWSELGTRADIPALRRELQRDHVNRLASQLLRPSGARADARSALRADAQALLARLNGATRQPGLSAVAKAHLSDSAETLALALDAKLQRGGV